MVHQQKNLIRNVLSEQIYFGNQGIFKYLHLGVVVSSLNKAPIDFLTDKGK